MLIPHSWTGQNLPCECFFIFSRGSTGREKNDKPLPSSVTRPSTFLRGSSSKELLLDNQAQEEQRREMLETVKQLTGGMEIDRNSAEADRNKAKETGKKLLRERWVSTLGAREFGEFAKSAEMCKKWQYKWRFPSALCCSCCQFLDRPRQDPCQMDVLSAMGDQSLCNEVQSPV